MDSNIKDYLNFVNSFLNKDVLKYPVESDKQLSEIYYLQSLLNSTSDMNQINYIIKELYVRTKVMKFSYGGEFDLLKDNYEYQNLINQLNSIHSIDDIDQKIQLIKKIDNDKVNLIRNITVINVNPNNITFTKDKTENNRIIDILNSVKDLFENEKIRQTLSNEELYLLITEFNNVVNHNASIEGLEKKLTPINMKVWKNVLTNSNDFKNGDSFNFLIHNFASIDTLDNLIKDMSKYRYDRISASLISDECVGMYCLNKYRRCGFIYPPNSAIITSGKHDLYSVEDEDYKVIKNKEYASTLISIPFLNKEQKKIADDKMEEFDYISNHNEIVLDSKNTKPSALYIMGYGENDINVDYDEIYALAKKLNLPVIEIDMSIYREKKNLEPLGKDAKEYIAYHTILSFYGLNHYDYAKFEESETKIFNNLIETFKDEICSSYIKLKNRNELSKKKMHTEFEKMLQKHNMNKDYNPIIAAKVKNYIKEKFDLKGKSDVDIFNVLVDLVYEYNIHSNLNNNIQNKIFMEELKNYIPNHQDIVEIFKLLYKNGVRNINFKSTDEMKYTDIYKSLTIVYDELMNKKISRSFDNCNSRNSLINIINNLNIDNDIVKIDDVFPNYSNFVKYVLVVEKEIPEVFDSNIKGYNSIYEAILKMYLLHQEKELNESRRLESEYKDDIAKLDKQFRVIENSNEFEASVQIDEEQQNILNSLNTKIDEVDKNNKSNEDERNSLYSEHSRLKNKSFIIRLFQRKKIRDIEIQIKEIEDKIEKCNDNIKELENDISNVKKKIKDNENSLLEKYGISISEYKDLLYEINSNNLTEEEITKKILEIQKKIQSLNIQDKEKEIQDIYINNSAILNNEVVINQDNSFKK